MAFFFLSTDSFKNTIMAAKNVDDAFGKLHTEMMSVRRPYRGIQIKEDTYATISVRRPNGSPILLFSSSDVNGQSRKDNIGKVAEYADFIIQSVQDQRQEKQQIIETFGDPFVYFFGERPRIQEVSGLLLNTEDFNWRAQFWENYDKHMRGTQLVQQNARVYLSYDTVVVEGYMLSANAQDTAENSFSIPFNFSMLVTNYYDTSTIGQTRFPWDGQGDPYDVLNKELEEQRSQYVSTGQEVRFKNLTAAPPGGVLATLRSGIRAVNDAVSFVGGLADTLHNVVGGRIVRMPIGIAGYLSSVGAATIAQGSISSDSLSAAALGKQYDAATGTFKGINGSVKLRMPGNASYAPPWVSKVTKLPRGYIFENIDEYPFKTSDAQVNMMSLDTMLKDNTDYLVWKTSTQAKRVLATSENDVQLALWNLKAEAGGWLASIAEGVAFAKANFGMIMSGIAFARDPLNSVKASLGIGIGTTSQSRIAGRHEELTKLGIKTSAAEEANKPWYDKLGDWVGGSAVRTFSNVATAQVETPKPKKLGEVYNEPPYSSSSGLTAGADYEAVYGDTDYANLVAVDPSAQESLDEVYGNNDKAPEGSNIDPSSLGQVYGAGTSSSSVRSPAEIAAALAKAQSASTSRDEDTLGITGVDDDGAQIESVI